MLHSFARPSLFSGVALFFLVYIGELFYAQMWKYVLTEDQLYQCGYPRSTDKAGVAAINRETGHAVAKIESVGPNAMKHECCRCHNPFIIYNNGQYQTVETCSYHYGRAFKFKGQIHT